MREKHKLSQAKDSADSDQAKPSKADDFRNEVRDHRGTKSTEKKASKN